MTANANPHRDRVRAHAAGPTRRATLRSGVAGILAAGAAPMFAPARLFGDEAPSNRITLGFIGVGIHGHGYNLKSFLHQRDAHVLAVCDVYGSRAERAKTTTDGRYNNSDCRAYRDFRDLLAADDLDAVCISTPDHWHVPISMMALEAGKDVMCEKPTYCIAEGRTLVDAVAKHKAVYQVGLEDRSVIYYHKMAEIVRNGGIGKLRTIRVTLPAGETFPLVAPTDPPDDLDYAMWLGPAPFAPYSPKRTDAQGWRNIRDYSGGKFTDWGSHLLDTANVANFAEQSGPVEVEGEGAVPDHAMTTTPVTYKLRYRYANDVELLVESGGISIRFEGSDGWVGNNGWRGRLESSDIEILKRQYDPQESKLWPMPPTEHRNFLDCIRTRQPTTYTAEAGHRLSSLMHIGNIAMQLGRKLRWDPQAEQFVDDDAANGLRGRTLHDDWRRRS